MTITINSIIQQLQLFGITDKLEQAHFLGQCDIESGGFKRLAESLNYTPEALLASWPNRFTSATAGRYGRTPQHPADQRMIANIAYGTRMGNEQNGTNDDDGWNYRGAGLIQLTGRDNHLGFLNWLNRQGKMLNLTIATVGDYARSEEGAIISAIYFWQKNQCGVHARVNDFAGLTKTINGCNLNTERGRQEVRKRTNATNKYITLLELHHAG